MLPEIILREEESYDLKTLFGLGVLSTSLGVFLATLLFPENAGFAAVMFSAVPLVYPLMTEFLADEKNKRPHIPEIMTYTALFAGEVLAFFLAALYDPSIFSLQTSIFELKLSQLGITGFAVHDAGTVGILKNNLIVFGFILGISSLIGSAGSFIVSWNASVLGVFLAVITKELSTLSKILVGAEKVPTPLAFIPHASLEMSGFIVAGIAGSLISASVYRRHFSSENWEDIVKLVMTGVSLIFAGAFLETGVLHLFFLSCFSIIAFGSWMR